MCRIIFVGVIFFFKQKTAYEMRISDWSSDVCSSDLLVGADVDHGGGFDPDKRRPVLDRGDDGMRKRIPMAGVPRRAQRALKFPDCAHRPVMPVWGVNFSEPVARAVRCCSNRSRTACRSHWVTAFISACAAQRA